MLRLSSSGTVGVWLVRLSSPEKAILKVVTWGTIILLREEKKPEKNTLCRAVSWELLQGTWRREEGGRSRTGVSLLATSLSDH